MLYNSANNVIIMSKTSVLAVRIDPDIMEKAEHLYASFGLNLSDAVSMFIHQSLLVKGLPFELKMPAFKGEFSIDDNIIKDKPVELSIDDIKRIVSPIAKKYNLKSLYLMGSRARGDNRPDSDYDFCYDMKEPSLLEVSGLMVELSEALNAEVDLISRQTKQDFLQEGLRRDGIAIYEE